jgi:hypothetical protein
MSKEKVKAKHVPAIWEALGVCVCVCVCVCVFPTWMAGSKTIG